MTKARTTAVLFSIALALTAWFYFVEREKLGSRLDPGRLFFRLLREDVESIQITRKGEKDIALERGEGDKWNMISPLKYRVEKGRIDTLLRGIVFLKAKVVVSEEAEGAFPEDGPRITLHFSAQGETHIVSIGNNHMTKDLVYYRVKDKVFLGNENLKLFCDRSVSQWRDRGVCPVMADTAGFVEIKHETGDAIVLERTGGGVWLIKEPVKFRGDPGLIGQMLKAFSGLWVKEFLGGEDGSGLEAYGLDRPRWTVRIRELEGIRDYTILIGSAVEETDPPELYVKRQDNASVFRCKDTVTRFLKLSAHDLHDRRVLPFEDYGWVNSIALSGPTVDFSLMRAEKGSDWTLIDRKKDIETRSPAKRGEQLVDTCRNLMIGEFLPGGHIGAERLRVTVHIDGVSDPMVLIIGKETEKGVFLGRRKGVEGEKDIPFKFPTRLLYDVGNTAVYEDLVRKRIKENKLHVFWLRTRKGRWLLERLSKWQVHDHSEVDIDKEIAMEAVKFICRPTASFYEPEPGRLKERGLMREYCRLRVSIPKSYGKYSYYELLVGKKVDEDGPLSYMKIDTDHVVFIADPTSLFKLADHIAEQYK